MHILLIIMLVIVALLVAGFCILAFVLPIKRFVWTEKNKQLAWIVPRDQGIMGLISGHAAQTYEPVPGGRAHVEWARQTAQKGKVAFLWEETVFSQTLQVQTEADARFLLSSEDFKKPGRIYGALANILGKTSLVSVTDDKVHNNLRRAINPAFSTRLINEEFGTVVFPHHVAAFCDFLASTNGEPTGAFLEYTERMTLDVVSDAAFRIKGGSAGDEVGRSLAEQLAELGNIMMKDYIWIVVPPYAIRPVLSFFSSKLRALYNRLNRCTDLIGHNSRLVAEAARKRDTNAQDRSFIDVIARNKGLTLDDMDSNIRVMSFAGSETTARVVSWCLYYMSRSPDLQDELCDELRDSVALDAVPTHDDVENLPLLQAIIDETLRIMPPVTGLPRVSTKAVTLPSGLEVMPGQEVGINLWWLQLDPEVWGVDAEQFRPHRWDNNFKASLKPCQYLPFSYGRRNCIGVNFAVAELRCALGAVFRRFKVQAVPGEEIPQPMLALTNKPCAPKKLRFVKRDN